MMKPTRGVNLIEISLIEPAFSLINAFPLKNNFFIKKINSLSRKISCALLVLFVASTQVLGSTIYTFL